MFLGALALVFAVGVALTFGLSFSVLAFVLTRGLALAFMFTVCSTLALVLRISMSLTFVLAVSLALAFVFTGRLTLTFVLGICMALAFMFSSGLTLTFMLASRLALTFVLSICVTLAFMFAGSALTLVLAFFCSVATSSAVLAACGQFLTGSGIGLHSIRIVTQLADLLTQLVGSGLLGIIIDRDFCRVGIVSVVFHALEERNIVFETVNAFLTFERSIGLNGDGLHLCISAQRHYGHQGQQD